MIDRPRWLNRQQLFSQNVPNDLESWLFDTSSLTARLVARCKGKFSVQVLSQKWQKIDHEEARAMQMAHVHSALVRQVLLLCDATPVVYARTVIPANTVSGAQRRYANMGRRPLGAMLFADRTMRREQVMVSRLPARHPVLRQPELKNAMPASVDLHAEIWGRRSVFRVSGKPLLVSEYFLPTLLA